MKHPKYWLECDGVRFKLLERTELDERDVCSVCSAVLVDQYAWLNSEQDLDPDTPKAPQPDEASNLSALDEGEEADAKDWVCTDCFPTGAVELNHIDQLN